ncbi:MAG: hypothetical protein PF484_05030 [Bacteroidales bacterium]|jgi:hypothetical protein|nr:hypothetical protein [Bacteroidales bacterium]
MNLSKTILAVTLFLFVHNLANSHEILSDWKLAKKSGDIELSYRRIEVGDTLTTRQMQISFFVDSEPKKIIKMFKDADKLTTWSAGIKKCEILQNEEARWTTYSLYNIPWPFEQKDLITEYQMVESSPTITLFMNAKPNQLPYYEDISRVEKYEGYWTFVPLENGKTRVEFYTVAFTKPKVPRFIQDPIIQSVLIDSINKLKTALAQQI